MPELRQLLHRDRSSLLPLPGSYTPSRVERRLANELLQIEPSNDPRLMHATRHPEEMDVEEMSTGSGLHFRRPGGSDSDPDEGDIEEQLHGRPHGYFMRRSPFDSPFGDRERAHYNEGDAILRRFADMLMNDLGAGRAMGASPGGGGLSPPEEQGHRHGPRVQQATFRAGPFGATHTRVTITHGVRGGPEDPPFNNFGTYVSPWRRLFRARGPQLRMVAFVRGDMSNTNDPPRLFGQLLGNPMVPGSDDRQRREGAGTPMAFGFGGGGLHELFTTLFDPAAAVRGDAVYTQEALDRIITQLMDASPQTNAAPPASQAAIDSLQRKRVDDEMLGPEGKAECTICIDEIKRGEEVVILPCKHWYHGECVVLWLKEHNTCPICRMPIEARGGGNGNNNSNGQGSSQPQQSRRRSQPSSPSNPASPGESASVFSSFMPFSSSSRPRGDRPGRSVRENLERLNAIRNAAGAGAGTGSGSGSGSGSDSRRSDSPQQSGLHRRNSLSPPGAWPSSDSSRSTRVRSPSLSRDRDHDRGEYAFHVYSDWDGRDYSGGRRNRAADAAASSRESQPQQQQEQGGNGGGGAFGWLRDHFGRGNGSGGGGAGGGGPERDRRR